MFRFLLCFAMAVAAALPAFSSAEVFKCTLNGSLVFSDKPCGDNAVVVEMKKTAPPASSPVVTQDMSALTNLTHELALKRRKAELNKEIDNIMTEIAATTRLMDLELQLLREKKQYANNNLAGAAWEQSISQEMTAITERYKIKVTSLENRLAQARTERAALN
jgi:hypothetical protein